MIYITCVLFEFTLLKAQMLYQSDTVSHVATPLQKSPGAVLGMPKRRAMEGPWR